MKQTKAGAGFILLPVFGGEMARQKNPNSQGFKGGDFFAEYKRKNTTRPLTVWIVGTVGLRNS